MLFTSGTTGLPKPIAISHRVVADRLAYYSKPIDPDAAQVVDMMSAPIFHIGGTLGLFISLHQGKELVLLPKFDAGNWLDLVERHRVAQTFVVPDHAPAHPRPPPFATTDLSSLRSLSYGAAAAPVDLVRRAVAALPGRGLLQHLRPDRDPRGVRRTDPGGPSSGRPVRLGGAAAGRCRVRIVEPGTGAGGASPVGWASSWCGPCRTRPRTWLHTGDIGRQDDQGYLYLAGRLSDTINRGGEKFGPVEVEEVLRTHPSVVDVGVVGVPDAELGERVGAVVVVSEPVTAEELSTTAPGRWPPTRCPSISISPTSYR